MKDAFGGTFMFKIMIIFLVLFISFMTIAVNYAKVFRIKNRLVDILEQTQYDEKSSDSIIVKQIDPFLKSFAYSNGDNNAVKKHCDDQGDNAVLTKNGACIVKMTDDDANGDYYRVFVYIAFSIPVLGNNVVIPINGDTDVIYDPYYFNKGIDND